MSLEENKAIVRRFIETYNKQNLDLSDDLVAPDYVDHTNKVDREGLKQLFNMGLTAFPDFHETIEDIIAEGDRVWVLLTYTGTHIGERLGLAPTGKKITCMAIDIYCIVNGKLHGDARPYSRLGFFQTTRCYRRHRKRKETLSRRCQVTALANISAIHMPIE